MTHMTKKVEKPRRVSYCGWNTFHMRFIKELKVK